MSIIRLPAFGEQNAAVNRLNRNACVCSLGGAEESAFDAYCALYAGSGYRAEDTRLRKSSRFAAFRKDSCGIFINYFRTTRELRIVEEETCVYFDRCDRPGAACVSPQITQISLEDFGLSYVVRLSDGRYIVFDGGRNFPPDHDKLLACLKRGCLSEKPVIAAWIMTHPHSDHFHCFLGFMERYHQEVNIESFLFNFPEADDLEHYPALGAVESAETDLSGATNIPRMLAWIEKTGAYVYTPHTGQRYIIGDAELEILSSMDDTIHLSQNINASSLVIRMTLGGQTILWTADAAFSIAKLPERYGEYLRADILQVPHHGFQSGDADAEIAGYNLIRPKVCLMPAFEYDSYSFFCAFKPGTNYLLQMDSLEEMITGLEERTLTLPYTPPAGAKEINARKFTRGQNSAGATTWIFTGLNTANPDAFVFTLLNAVVSIAHVRFDLYFGDGRSARDLRVTLKHCTLREINILGSEVDKDAPYYNSMPFSRCGVPENQIFAVRFMSDIPIVVSHKDHAPAYHSTL